MVGIHDRTIWFAVAQETKVLTTIGVFVGFLCIYALIGQTYRMQGFMTCEVPPKVGLLSDSRVIFMAKFDEQFKINVARKGAGGKAVPTRCQGGCDRGSGTVTRSGNPVPSFQVLRRERLSESRPL
jgi:hypothetical protein